MGSITNRLTVPEIADYQREIIDGLAIVRYLVREPGAADWSRER